jgi:branched-chain amino acid aminotransferase
MPEERPGQFIWKNGDFIQWKDASIHLMSHVVHYGSSVFEGIRVYKTNKGPAVFRLTPHMKRLLNSAKIYRMQPDYAVDTLIEASKETVRRNKFEECYIRPIVFRGLGQFGVNPFNSPIETYIATWFWGKYLGPEALEQGIDVCVSSWTRIAPNTLPAMAKAGANYMNSQLIKMEAIKNGFVEGIALDQAGFVSEGSGENIFFVMDGKVLTPPLGDSVLPGITRDSVIELCKEKGLEVIEKRIPREMIYIADEIFFTGSAAEITPIRSVDHITVGEGHRGPVTTMLQERFFGILDGSGEDNYGWLEFV